MEVQVQSQPQPPTILENGAAQDPEPHPAEFNGHRHANGGEAELPVSKSQRRHSDVKVYKEFCDFYARL